MKHDRRRDAFERKMALDRAAFPRSDEMSRRQPTEGDPERRPVAEGILRFFDVANRYWANYAAMSAPELSILMDLYVNEQDCRPVSIGDACIAARVPSTSALRSIDGLIGSGMLVRCPDPRDSRRKLLQLTERSRALVRGFVDEVGAQGRGRS